MRIMALDIGDVRIGVALSDPMRTIASPYETYRRVGFVKDIEYLIALAREKEADVVVSGLPLAMDGKDSEQSRKVREFMAEFAKRYEGTVAFMDERFTTVSAERMLIGAGVRRDNRKKVVDKIAASMILQSYLDTQKNH